MAHQYFCDSDQIADFKVGHLLSFGGDEAKHAVKVSRLRVGEEVRVANGLGLWGLSEVVHAAPDLVTVRLKTVNETPASLPRLVLVQALAKGDRAERAVEQATEFGVDEIVLWQAQRSVVRLNSNNKDDNKGDKKDDKVTKAISRWQKIAREASKQSLRARVPECQRFIAEGGLSKLGFEAGAAIFVLHPGASTSLAQEITEIVSGEAAPSEICFFVGPEGGISDTELNELAGLGAREVLLGSNVLRTSSAGAAALAVANTVLKKW